MKLRDLDLELELRISKSQRTKASPKGRSLEVALSQKQLAFKQLALSESIEPWIEPWDFTSYSKTNGFHLLPVQVANALPLPVLVLDVLTPSVEQRFLTAETV